VWACCDGKSTLDDIVRELAGIFAVEPATIEGDVHAAVTELAALGLVVTDEHYQALDRISTLDHRCHRLDGHRYLSFTPCGCGPDLDREAWAATVALDVGDVRLGARCPTDDLAADVRDHLADLVVDDDRVDASFSIQVRADDRFALYENDALLGELTRERLLAWVDARVRQWGPAPDGGLRIEALALEGPNGAALLPILSGGVTAAEDRARRRDEHLRTSPVVVDLDARSVGGRPLRGIVVEGDGTARIEGLVAFRALLPKVSLRGDEDLDRVTDQLTAVTREVAVVTAARDDLHDTAAALVRAR